MANLSLREVAQSQLDQAPVIDGQLIVCTDTGSTYRDIGTKRIQISKDLEIVSSLPLAPLSNKIYYLRPDSLYVYSGDDWILLNPSKFTLEADKNAVNGEVNINLVLNGTAQDKIKIAGGGVTTVTTGETGDITIDTPHPDELLAALTNDEIDAITGGMVDDSGNPLPTPQVVVDATLTVSGRAADAKVTGTKIAEALSIAKSADTGLTNVRTELDNLKLDSVAVDKTLTKESSAADAKAVGDALAKKANAEHNHDDRYYTEDEVNVKLSKKSDSDHTHDERYYQQNEIDEKLKSIKTDWNSVTDKPSTFPSTWDSVSGKPSVYPTNWGNVSGKPSSYPPSAHNHSKLEFENKNEVNFVGIPENNTVYWGYRGNTIDEYRFNDGRGSGSFANVRANKFIGSLDGNADTATKATGVTDYKDASRTIQVGYASDGLNTSNLTHIAGYTDNGTKIKDVSKAVLQSWLGISGGSLAAYPVGAIYISTSSTSPASLFGGS